MWPFSSSSSSPSVSVLNRHDLFFFHKMLCFSFTQLNTCLKAHVSTFMKLLCCQLAKQPSVFDVDDTLFVTFYTLIFPVGLVYQASDLQNLNKSYNEDYDMLSLERRL